MATEVELNGMTINLVPDKATYDGMEKNANEMYLVQDDYDMILDVFNQPESDVTKEQYYTVNVISGSMENLLSKLNENPSYIPKVFVKAKLYYSVDLTVFNSVVTPWVEYFSNSHVYIKIMIPWIFYGSHLYISISDSGTASAVVQY